MLSGVPAWVRALVAVVVFAPLHRIPADLGTVLFWGPALVAWVAFVISGIGEVLRWRREGLAAGSLPIGKGVAVLVILVDLAVLRLSISSADAFALARARIVQDECNAVGRCPTVMAGWQCEEELGSSIQCRTQAGSWGTRYLVTYIRDTRADGRFALLVRHSLDHRLVVTGGAGIPLTVSPP